MLCVQSARNRDSTVISGHGAGFKVFIEGLSCPPEEFALNLIAQGMDAARIDELIHAIPCYLKTDVTRQVAVNYGEAFRRAGGIIRIESPGPVELDLPPQESQSGPPPIELEVGAREELLKLAESAPAEVEAAAVPPLDASPVPISAPALESLPAADNVIPQLELRRPGDSSAFPAISPAGGSRDIDLGEPAAAPVAREPVVEELGLDLGGPTAPPPSEFDAPSGGDAEALELDAPTGRDAEALEIDLPPPRAVAPGAGAPATGQGGAARERPGAPKRKPIVIKPVPEPEPEPWLKRRYPHLIAISVLLIAASYLYGCTKVMASSVKFRREVGDIETALGNMNGRGQTVTDADVVAAVKEVGKRCGLDIASGDIRIEAEELRQIEVGRGRCRFSHVPDLVQRMSAVDQQMIMKSVQSCTAPRWILSVHVNSRARWGLFSHEIEATRTVAINSYEP